ncbi:hypothetical protein LZ32DRAFT_619746 [Colletotrichum eremochloae]|nr:hypothetical protein LZ32DRAFT_619746 [Colletotrichum eremochloae]
MKAMSVSIKGHKCLETVDKAVSSNCNNFFLCAGTQTDSHGTEACPIQDLAPAASEAFEKLLLDHAEGLAGQLGLLGLRKALEVDNCSISTLYPIYAVLDCRLYLKSEIIMGMLSWVWGGWEAFLGGPDVGALTYSVFNTELLAQGGWTLEMRSVKTSSAEMSEHMHSLTH